MGRLSERLSFAFPNMKTLIWDIAALETAHAEAQENIVGLRLKYDADLTNNRLQLIAMTEQNRCLRDNINEDARLIERLRNLNADELDTIENQKATILKLVAINKEQTATINRVKDIQVPANHLDRAFSNGEWTMYSRIQQALNPNTPSSNHNEQANALQILEKARKIDVWGLIAPSYDGDITAVKAWWDGRRTMLKQFQAVLNPKSVVIPIKNGPNSATASAIAKEVTDQLQGHFGDGNQINIHVEVEFK